MTYNEITEFPQEVIDEIKYYVYRLIDPRNGETFYVGKGKGNRVFQHIKCALAQEDADQYNDKYQTIREIKLAGLDVIHVIHKHGMNEDVAKAVEAALIDAYPSATNLAGGTGSSDYGPMHASEIVNKYKAEEAIFKHKVLMITINKSATEKDIYDATRFAWKIDKNKAAKAEFILSVKQGIIREVFIAKEWKIATVENFPQFQLDEPNRYAFIGRKADDKIRFIYINKRIPKKYRKKGAANPIKYSF